MTASSLKILKNLLILFVILSYGCQDDDNRPIAPPKYLAIDKTYQSFVEAGKVKAQTIRAMVLDADSLPRENVTVFFTFEGDISLSASSAITNAEGYASVDVTFGSKIGDASVVASSPGLEGSPATFDFIIRAITPKNITIFSGDEQEDLPGEALANQLVVRLTDEFQNPVSGASITFKVTKSNGNVFWASSHTNQEGNASNYFRVGSDGPINEITASYNEELKTVFRAYTLTPVKLSPLKNGKDHIELNWTKDVNPTFERYVISRALQGYTTFTAVAEITDINVINYKDYSGIAGAKYWYYVKTVTSQQNSIISTWEKSEYGDYINFSSTDQFFDVSYDEPKGIVYVSNTTQRRILILSMETLQKVDSIQLDANPTNMALSSNRELLYVSLAGTGSFCVIQLSNKSILKRIDVSSALGTKEIGDIYQTSSGELFASSVYNYTVKINEADNTVQRVATNYAPSTVAGYFVGDDGAFLYKESYHEILKLDLTHSDVPFVNRMRSGSEGACLSPDGSRIYVYGSILDTQDFSLVGRLGHGGRIALSKDGLHLYKVYSGFVAVYNTTTQLLERQIPFAQDASALFINESESTAIIQTKSSYPYPHFMRFYKLSLAD